MPNNTPSWEEEARKILEQLQYGTVMADNSEPALTNNLEIALEALNSAAKELVLASKPEPVTLKDWYGEGYNTALTDYQANIIKAIEGKAE